MRRKKLLEKPQTYASSAEDFAQRLEPMLSEVIKLMKGCGEELRAEILKELCAKRLVISLPSICYALPFPFVLLNARILGDKVCPDWSIPRPDSLIRGSKAIYVGFRLDSMDELEEGQIHLCVRDIVEEPIIALCHTTAEHSIEVLKRYWNPRNSIDEFLRQLDATHSVITSIACPSVPH